MKINCENVSNRGNGDNCKISPKDSRTSLSQSCTFSREYSKLNSKLNGDIKEKRISLCKNLNDCYAKEKNHNYWQEELVPQVQAALLENKKIEREKTKKPP